MEKKGIPDSVKARLGLISANQVNSKPTVKQTTKIEDLLPETSLTEFLNETQNHHKLKIETNPSKIKQPKSKVNHFFAVDEDDPI